MFKKYYFQVKYNELYAVDTDGRVLVFNGKYKDGGIWQVYVKEITESYLQRDGFVKLKARTQKGRDLEISKLLLAEKLIK